MTDIFTTGKIFQPIRSIEIRKLNLQTILCDFVFLDDKLLSITITPGGKDSTMVIQLSKQEQKQLGHMELVVITERVDDVVFTTSLDSHDREKP